MVEYVKGAAPDRWHWIKECKQYPTVIIESRNWRPHSDLCDYCQEIERKALLKVQAVE